MECNLLSVQQSVKQLTHNISTKVICHFSSAVGCEDKYIHFQTMLSFAAFITSVTSTLWSLMYFRLTIC